MRDFMSVVRAKSAHPLGRGKQSASRVGLGHRDRSAEMSVSMVNSTFAVSQENKYDKLQKWKEKKEIMRSFTDKKLDKQQRYRNREQIQKIKDDLEETKKKPDNLDRKERSDILRDHRYRQMDMKIEAERVRILSSVKISKEKVKKEYEDKFPKISNDVRELREKEYKEKFMNDIPLHQKLLKDFEEREGRRLKEVKDQLHQLKVQPIDFVVCEC